MLERSMLTMLLAFGVGAWVGCNDHQQPGTTGNGGHGVDAQHSECEGNACICPDANDCDLECTTTDCDLQCLGGGDCIFACGDDCRIECAGAGSCRIDVGRGGEVFCEGGGDCQIDVDQGSAVRCSGAGDCDVVCHGDCTVECIGGGECLVSCVDGVEGAHQTCELGQACGAC